MNDRTMFADRRDGRTDIMIARKIADSLVKLREAGRIVALLRQIGGETGACQQNGNECERQLHACL